MFDYPALYGTASGLSANSQRDYLNLIRGEYALLLIASIFAMSFATSPAYNIAYAFVFMGSLATLAFRSWHKPEQHWYKGRALAESIKTSVWRYCMRAQPFGDANNLATARAEFRNHLRAILDANRHVGERMPSDSAAEDQITVSMEQVRSLSLQERIAFYDEHRIRDQRKWYAAKAGANQRASRRWLIAGVCGYALAILMVLLRIAYPQQQNWPIEPLIVAASSLIGWTQIKKFNELASSYSLTAHEIGIIQGRSSEVASEDEFSDFVNEAEQAFSREHTQWVARQQST